MVGFSRKPFSFFLWSGLLALVACGDTSSGVDEAADMQEQPAPTEIVPTEEIPTQSSTVQSSSSLAPVAISSSMDLSSGQEFSSSSTEPLPNNGIPYIRILMEDSSALSLTDSLEKPIYSECTVEIAGNGRYADVPLRGARIKLRGNSTRLWYDKKPYRIKFSEKTEVLGLAANKDWVLLANFRDPTNFMNALAFDMAREMGHFGFVNGSRFVEVEVNGDYKGLYQLTEQVEQAESRVNVSPSGVLLSLDKDDGPELSPTATDNFWSATYKLPVSVKYPKTLSAEDLEQIRSDFKQLEDAIAAGDYNRVDSLLDLDSFIDFLILQEVTRNVELEAPRSMYLHRTSDQGKYAFGPVWDFDGGFGYSWNEETKEYFSSDTWILGSVNPSGSPYNCTVENQNDWGMCKTQGTSGFGGFGGSSAWDGSAASGFWTNLFSNEQFLVRYKSRWTELSPKLLTLVPERLDSYLEECGAVLSLDSLRWPWPNKEHDLGKDSRSAVRDLEDWIIKRISDYSAVLDEY